MHHKTIFFLLRSIGCGYRDNECRFPTASLATYFDVIFIKRCEYAVFCSIISRNIVHRMDETLLSSATMHHPYSNIFYYIEIERNEQPLFCGCVSADFDFFYVSFSGGKLLFFNLLALRTICCYTGNELPISIRKYSWTRPINLRSRFQ